MNENTGKHMKDYEGLIEGCFEDFICSDDFKTIMQKRIAQCMQDAIEDSFRWGDLKNAMNKKITDVLVPYIEAYDMNRYTVKLDVLLGELADQTAIADNRRILENFGTLIADPVKETITLKEVFDAYAKYVAKNASGSGMEVEDGYYLPVEIACDVEERSRRGFISQWEEVTVNLTADVPDDDERDDLSFTLMLHRWSNGKPDEYRLFTPRVQPTIASLVRMNDFEIFLARLDRGSMTITGIEDMRDSVDIDAQPEYELV